MIWEVLICVITISILIFSKKPNIKGLSLTFFILVVTHVSGQETKSVSTTNTSHKTKKSFIFGDLWYIAGSYSVAKTNEFSINLGRTQSLSGAILEAQDMTTFGIGYTRTLNNGQVKELGNLFAEWTSYGFLPIGIRGDYLYDFKNNAHYLRPSLGLSFLYFDVFYNYTIALSGRNIFRHGLTLRIKYFLK